MMTQSRNKKVNKGGRPRLSSTHGTPAQRHRDQPSLSSFFSPSHTNVNSSTQLHASLQSFTQIHANSQSQVVVAKRETEEEDHTKIEDIPNFDADEDIFNDDELSFTGKRISASENLMFQQEVIMSPKYYKMAYERIDKLGALWDHPPTYIKNGKNPLQKSWLDFFRLRIFNWIPEVLIGDNSWKTSCPNCRKELSKNGNGNPPRLVFDQYDNYWLNALNRYICLTCRNTNDMIQNENEKLTYSF